jgi:hypothetical protein
VAQHVEQREPVARTDRRDEEEIAVLNEVVVAEGATDTGLEEVQEPRRTRHGRRGSATRRSQAYLFL